MTVAILLSGIILYYAVGRELQNLILVALSAYVYWIAAPESFCTILCLSVVMAAYTQILQSNRKAWILWQPIVILISIFTALRILYGNVGSIPGFSVIAFSSISLLVDQYKTNQRYSFLSSLSFILFVPKIFAGPLVKADKFIDTRRKNLNWKTIYKGCKYLIFASFCKLIVADTLLQTDYWGTGLELFFQILAFALNFFFDFWAYSMMAIGVGLLMGYKLPINFYRPYYSFSLREFWHRWNITLGVWLRDYVYIPLGGKHNRGWKWSGTVLLVFIISGLWHGSTLPFIIWGGTHGVILIIERLIIKPDRFNRFFKICYAVLLFIIVAFLWQLFILDDLAAISGRFEALKCSSAAPWMQIVRFALSFATMMVLTSHRILYVVEGLSSSRRYVVAEVSVLSVMLICLILFNIPVSFNFFYFRF